MMPISSPKRLGRPKLGEEFGETLEVKSPKRGLRKGSFIPDKRYSDSELCERYERKTKIRESIRNLINSFPVDDDESWGDLGDLAIDDNMNSGGTGKTLRSSDDSWACLDLSSSTWSPDRKQKQATFNETWLEPEEEPAVSQEMLTVLSKDLEKTTSKQKKMKSKKTKGAKQQKESKLLQQDKDGSIHDKAQVTKSRFRFLKRLSLR